MNDDKFAPVNNTDAVSAEDLLAQADALLSVEETPAADVFAPQEAASEASAPAAQTPSQTTYPYPQGYTLDQNSVPAQYAAPEGYELRYVQTPQGYQPVYMPIAQPVYPPEYSQPYQPMYAPQSPQPAADQRKARSSAPQSRPAGALRERPRKKPWGKILGATVLSAAIVALVVWGVVAGATALIRSFGRDRNSSMGGYYEDGGYYGDWNGMGGYGDDIYYIDQDGNLVDGNGNIIGNVHDGGYFQDEGGNTVIISPIGPNGSPDNSSEYVEGDASYYFVHAGSGLNLRDEPDGSRIANIPNGYPVRVLGWKGEWAYVAYDSSNDTSLGWVNGSYLSGDPAINPTKYYVHADGGLNMRSQPSTSGSRILTIPEGEVVYSQAYCDDWTFVSYNGWYGWVSGDYISTSASKPAKPQQGNQGSSGGYTTADIEAAIAEAKEYYRSRKGKAPNSGLRGDSLTDEQVEELYWKAVGLVVGMDYHPAGQFETIVGSLEVKDDPYAWIYQVSDPNIKSMEDWADLFYSSLTDDLACDILCGAPMFMLDGKMYISGGAMGDAGLGTEYTIRIEKESSGYKLIMDVVNTREDDYTGTVERMQWSFTAHCFKEDGVWVFDDADTPYR